jgi:hypothetical protein
MSWRDSSVTLAAGNVTKVAAPYVDFTVALDPFRGAPKCTLRYRALTSTAAKLLGAPLKPCPKGKPGCASVAGTCPAGQYLETKTDVKPAPCLPCPPGTYNKAPSSKACKPCPLGKFAAGYGNKACKSCPAGKPLTPRKGAATCQPCGYSAVRVGVNKCQSCPKNSNTFVPSTPRPDPLLATVCCDRGCVPLAGQTLFFWQIFRLHVMALKH